MGKFNLQLMAYNENDKMVFMQYVVYKKKIDF